MALGGSYNDLYIRQYTDMIEHELQQDGSRLRPVVTVEQVQGERTYFNKIGKVSSYQRTARLEDVQLSDQSFERRFVTPIRIESAVALDQMDLDRYLRSPQPELAQAIAKELGRQMDEIIEDAIAGNAARELNGVLSNAPFDTSNFSIAVNSNLFAGSAMTGDTGLHEGKIIQARQKMETAYAISSQEMLYVLAPAKQIAGMMSRSFSQSGAAFRAGNPYVDQLLNVTFVPYEGFGVDGSSDQIAYVMPKSAIKLGIWQDIKFRADERLDKAGAPTQLMANMALGAVRMFEEKVVRVLCDPSVAFA